jgi:branched-chain amino acid transport system ATP-binding protein
MQVGLETFPDQSAVSGTTLTVKDLDVTYSGVVALAGVSLSALGGQVLGVIGPNGAGKTTLFDVISGLRKPNGGRIYFNGKDVTGRSAVWRSRAGMRRTFQRQQIFGRLTVEENLLCAIEWRGGGGGLAADVIGLSGRRRLERRRREAIDEIIEFCGLRAERNAMAGSLPLGTSRMVELGRALVDSPSLLLLDEPTSGLSHGDIERVSEVIHRVRNERSCATVLIEHDITFIMAHCDRIVVLQRGEVLAEGTPSEIQAHGEVRKAYLG